MNNLKINKKLININSNNNIFISIFLMYVYDLDLKEKNNIGRPIKYNNNLLFYNTIIKFIENGSTWKTLNNECSYSTYYRKFIYWTENNVFINVYKIFINFLKNNNILTYKDLNNTYIDTSNIRNKQGIDLKSKNYADKNKKGTKISFIVSQTGIPLAIECFPCNVHDVKTVKKTINNSIIPLKSLKLGGDKGYISNELENELKNKYKIKYIIQQRNKRRTKDEIINDKKNKNINKKFIFQNNNKFMKKRIIVENTFSWIKNNKRIQLRYDKYSKNYKSFLYLACIKLVSNRFNLKYFNKNNIKYPTITLKTFRVYKNKIINK